MPTTSTNVSPYTVSVAGPLYPFKYYLPIPSSVSQGGPNGGGGGSWSAQTFVIGSYRTFLRFQYDDSSDIPPQPVSGHPDEDFWINAVAPTQALLIYPQQWTFDEQFPANLFGQFDEDFWRNPVAPVQATLLYPQPSIFDEQFPANLFGQFDEDFWINPVAPVQASFLKLYLPDPEEIPAASLHGIYEEDAWVNPVLPTWSYPTPTVFSFDDILVQQPAAFQPDEDFWQNPVAPVVIYNIVPMPYLFDAVEVVPQPVVGTQNYVNTGMNNYVSQQLGFGVQF